MPDLTLPIAIAHVVVFGTFGLLILLTKNWEKVFFGLMAVVSLAFALFSLVRDHPNDALAIAGFAVMMGCAYLAVHLRE